MPIDTPYSHRVVLLELEKGKLEFKLPTDLAERLGAKRTMLLEVRGDGHYTMVPPSVHPSGEAVAWHEAPKEIPRLESEELVRRCGLLAALSAIVMSYPQVQGERDEICLALAGTLVRAGLPDQEIDQLIRAVAELAGDEEAETRGDKARASRAKIDAGEPAWGLPELCKRLGLEALEAKLRDWLGFTVGVSPNDSRPRITVWPGQMPSEVDEAEAALLAADFSIYQRSGQLVRVVRLPHSVGDNGVRRAGGIILLQEVKQPWLLEKFALVAMWTKIVRNKQVVINPPASHASQFLARAGEWRAPVLNGVVSTPTMRRDGSILQKPGFDPASGLLFEPNGVEYPTVPECPTWQDADTALKRLTRPLRNFKLPTKADRSVVLATMLTALIRRNLPSAPLIAIDAPTAGSGTPGTSFGAHVWNGGPAVLNQHIFNVKFNREHLDRDFFRLAINQKLNELIAKAHGGVGLRHVTKGKFEETKIALPPLPEQRRIVGKLEILSARTTTTRTHLTAIAQLVERYRQAVIDAAFKPIELSTPLLELVDQATGIPYGIVQTGEHTDHGVPTVRAGDIKAFKLSEDGLKRVAPGIAAQYERTRLKGGEVLIAIRGSVGETCIVPSTMEGNNISREVALIPVAPGTDAAFIMYFLRSYQAAAYIKANIKGVAQTGINLRDLKRLPSPNISEEQQRAIVRRIETAFAKIDRLAAEAEKALKLADRLDQRVLAKAFAGELVAQGPEDEPAGELLARIREERSSRPKTKRRSANGRKATSASTKKADDMSNKKRSDVSGTHLSELLQGLGGAAASRDLWLKSEMDLNEFYKLLRDEVAAGRIKEAGNKERLVLGDAA